MTQLSFSIRKTRTAKTRRAWHGIGKLSGFTPATDFDWKEFDKPAEERKVITLDHIREVFCDGKKRLELKEAAHDLATRAEVTDSAAYNALKEGGKFSANISRSNGMLTFHSTKFPRKSR
jgi:Cu/Ag efflux protein CusF